MPAPIVAIVNQKGGVGKTTTAINLAAALAERGRHVLLVDCDPQGNATSGLGVIRSSVVCSSYDVIIEGRPIAEACRPTLVPGLDLIPAEISLAGADIELVSMPRSRQRLHYALEGISEYDLVLIDCPPSLGLLTINAVVAAESLLIPIQCEYYALEGVGLLTQTLTRLRQDLNPTLRIAGIVMTLYDSRLALASQVVAEVRRQFPDELLDTIIPRNVRLSEAPSHGLPITRYDSGSRGARAYRALAEEFAARLGLAATEGHRPDAPPQTAELRGRGGSPTAEREPQPESAVAG